MREISFKATDFDCVGLPSCMQLVNRELQDLSDYTKGCSVMTIPVDPTASPLRRTFRKRCLRAERKGYYVKTFEPRDFYEDIRGINHSLPVRQRRPMSSSYLDVRRASFLAPVLCGQHNNQVWGVFRAHTFGSFTGQVSPQNELVGYASIYRCGELVHVSMFLGHGDFLEDGIMYLLIRDIMRQYPGEVLLYGKHNSGGPGLQWFKERIGLAEEDVRWIL